MKKYSIYIICALSGVLIGWLLFGNSVTTESETDQHTTIEEQWTCSMHPQIKLDKQGSCPICGMDLIPVTGSGDGLQANEIKMTANAMALANIETSVVGSMESSGTALDLSGKIQPNEQTNATQTAHFGGRIEQLYVNSTGEKIYKGQLLATIYSPELVAAQQELLTALKTKEQDPALYKAVRNKLRLWKLTEDQILGIEQSLSIISNFSIYADVSGIVTQKLVEPGNHVKEGQGLFMISNLNTVWAEFDIYENQLALISVGDKVSIGTNAHPGKNFQTEISFIEPVLNDKTRTVVARAVLNNTDGLLKPGMFISGIVKSASKNQDENAIVIPKSAVMWTGKRSLVYVRKQGNEPVFEMRVVTLGVVKNGNYEILGGLKSGEEIVTNGTFTVDAAAQLQGKNSMMNADLQDPMETNTEFKQYLNKVFENYINLKNAMVADNPETSREHAKQLYTVLNTTTTDFLMDSDADETWQIHVTILRSKSKAINESNDLEIQRKHFLSLSDHMIKSVELFGIDQIAYKQFCPMANNDQGGFWLSKEEEILNPYFGASMLRCGSVEAIIE